MISTIISDASIIGSYIFKLALGDRLRGNYQKLQGKRLKALVKHAYENVDFYRDKYDEVGVKPEDIQSVEDIRKLPLVTRDDLRRNFPQRIIARNIDLKDCQIFRTSGSTGSPVEIYRERMPVAFPLYFAPLIPKILESLVKKRGRLTLMGILLMIEETAENLFSGSWINFPSKLIRVEVVQVDALDDPREHLRAWRMHRPDLVVTYPSVLKNMAILLRQQKDEALPQPIQLYVTAESLDKDTRELISKVFKGDIVDCYGATETELIAMECTRHEGMHIQMGNVVLEILQDGKPALPGMPGEVVVTNLRNKATPLIRYSGLGDVAVLSDRKCSCGSPMPLLERVEGRIVDSVILPDGRIIHPFRLTHALLRVPSIAKFQIIQETMNKVKVLIVAEDSRHKYATSLFKEGEPLWNMIMSNLRDLLGEDISITIEEVEDITTSPGSQHSVVRSLVGKSSF
jgi:phenylacetate-CoA ligase